jgi:xylose isomerase
LDVEIGARFYVFWDGREGTESNTAKEPAKMPKRFREVLNYLCAFVLDQGYDIIFSLAGVA